MKNCFCCFLIALVSSVFLFSGCDPKKDYHDGNGTIWIMEQVEKGYITKEQAYILLQQEYRFPEQDKIEQPSEE